MNSDEATLGKQDILLLLLLLNAYHYLVLGQLPPGQSPPENYPLPGTIYATPVRLLFSTKDVSFRLLSSASQNAGVAVFRLFVNHVTFLRNEKFLLIPNSSQTIVILHHSGNRKVLCTHVWAHLFLNLANEQG